MSLKNVEYGPKCQRCHSDVETSWGMLKVALI